MSEHLDPRDIASMPSADFVADYTFSDFENYYYNRAVQRMQVFSQSPVPESMPNSSIRLFVTALANDIMDITGVHLANPDAHQKTYPYTIKDSQHHFMAVELMPAEQALHVAINKITSPHSQLPLSDIFLPLNQMAINNTTLYARRYQHPSGAFKPLSGYGMQVVGYIHQAQNIVRELLPLVDAERNSRQPRSAE